MVDSPMTPPKLYTATLVERIDLTEKFIHLKFELVEPHTLEFVAGQYASISMPDGQSRRSYSMCHSPSSTHGFELMVDVSPGGIGSTYLNNLKIGEQIVALSPLGRFTVEPFWERTTPIVFIATGSGITPYRSMISALFEAGQTQRPMTLFWGLRNVKDLFWQDEFQRLAQQYPSFHFHPVISRPEVEWPLCVGRVTDCLTIHQLPADADYLLCGNASMIQDATLKLEQLGVPKDRLHFEKFY
jgi:ferredoxin-NADP reductase